MYRGIDDYQHSWVVDLIVKYVIGLQPDGSETLTLNPLPFGLRRFVMEGIRYRGRTIDVRWDAHDGFTLHVDGEERARNSQLQQIDLPLG